MPEVGEETWKMLEEILVGRLGHEGVTPAPLHERFRALFTLKNIATDRAVEIIGKAFADPSALLKHELAYVLGQMRLPVAIPILSTVLENGKEDPMVRHEVGDPMDMYFWDSGDVLKCECDMDSIVRCLNTNLSSHT